ncbi:hypothetical protein, partial [Acinetobacter bereziniae]|uniref:hypothetical protein n=1 Tax=Acinetobacter bereziniae TaxID=106648 RepID=UPI001C0825EF
MDDVVRSSIFQVYLSELLVLSIGKKLDFSFFKGLINSFISCMIHPITCQLISFMIKEFILRMI